MSLRKRIIPFLTISNGELIKTINFKNQKYIGDPLNAIKIFNQKKADEIVILDIDCTSKKSKIDFDLIKSMSSESRMPLSYGGGINTFEDVKKIIDLGIEKIVLGSLFFKDIEEIYKIINYVGAQSVSICFDYKFINNQIFFYTDNGTNQIKISESKIMDILRNLNCGEIIFNDINRDGLMCGVDKIFINYISNKIKFVPITFVGGLSSYSELKDLIDNYDFSGIGAGSLFLFKGKLKAVLINYDNLQ